MASEQSSVDTARNDAAQERLRQLMAAIGQLARSDASPEEFLTRLLPPLVETFGGAVAAAVWLTSESGTPQLAAHVRLEPHVAAELADPERPHGRLIARLLASGQTALVGPQSLSEDQPPVGNPTAYQLLMAPLTHDRRAVGQVELFITSSAPLEHQGGNLKLLARLCNVASEWFKNRAWREVLTRHSHATEIEQFARRVHDSLDSQSVAYCVANEGRRLIGCDRVSIVLRRGGRSRVVAVSGQAQIDRRANLVVTLAHLAEAVAAAGQPLWYDGAKDDLAPQIEAALDAFVEEAWARTVVVLPLFEPAGDAQTDPLAAERSGAQPALGALVAECLEIELPRADFARRLEPIHEHARRALANAVRYEAVPLRMLWQALDRVRWLTEARQLPKVAWAAAIAVTVIAGLVLVPADMRLRAEGQLLPQSRQGVFVDVPGVVEKLHVRHGEQVRQGDLLAELRNTDLDVQLADIVGQLEAARQQLRADERLMLDTANLSTQERNHLATRRQTVQRQIDSLEAQRNLLEEKRARLAIRSPIDGQVLTWDVEDRLRERPVLTGQKIMVVADSSGPWELEVQVSEQAAGHVLRAQESAAEPLRVAYILASEPTVQRTGQVRETAILADGDNEHGHGLRLRVDLEAAELEHPRAGTSVRCRVACGRRAIGYVWFHEALEWLHSRVLF